MSETPDQTPEKTRPGHNGGGSLKSGNTVGVGRKPEALRQMFRAALDDTTIKRMQGIARGTLKLEARDMYGKVYKRLPTAKESIDAAEFLAKYGIGTKLDVTTDDQPLKAYINVDDERM